MKIGSAFLLACGLHFSCAVFAAETTQDTILVSRDDMALTRSDFEAAISVVPLEKRQKITPTVKQVMAFLENTMVAKKLANEARELGLDKDPIIQREMQQAADRVLGQRRLEAFEAGLKFPDFETAARERYLVKKSEFVIPEAVRASHIVISTQDRSDEDAKQKAQNVRQKILAGDDFSTLAKEYSDDPSKNVNFGDLGFFERKQMVKPFEDAAFSMMKPGEVSPVIKTKFGYHVIRLTEKRAERQKSFEEVKDQLIKDLRDKFVSDAKTAYISAIKNDKSIVINEAAIEAMFKK